MKRLTVILLLALSVAAGASGGRARKGNTAGLKYLDTHFHLYDSLQKSIWNFAETGYNEVRSSEQWVEFLKKEGFTVETRAAGIPTAFVATYGNGGPVIGMMAEYDAIAGMSQDTVPYRKALFEGSTGHACGHNLLGTGSVAGAVAVSKWLAEGHKGTVKLFGCPAEEGGGGKAYMMREGVFEGLDAMLDWHPDTRNTVNATSGLANVQVQFTFKGRSSHASGAPEQGRSALDAVEAFDHMMNLMREHVPQNSRIHYVITDGGKAPNVVPDRASVKYYFRSPSREVVKDILDRAIKAAEGAALGTGCTMDYELVSGNYERLPNEAMADLVYRKLQEVGGIKLDARELGFAHAIASESGADASLIDRLAIVVPPAEEGYEAYVSSDVGNVTWAVPTGSFRYACFAPGGVGHSWQQTASGGTTIGTKGALGAARVLYLSAVELMSQPSVLAAVREEFRQRRGPGFKFEPLMGSRRPPFLPAATLGRSLTPELIATLPTPTDAALQARVKQSGIDAVAKDGLTEMPGLEGLDVFLPSRGITDQDESGRCWYFATSNVLRSDAPNSAVFPYFWDMLEKANLFLVDVWDHRKEPLDSRVNESLFKRPTWDGGHFMEATWLLDKYGAVPEEVMPETSVSADSEALRRELRSMLRGYGLRLRETSDPEALRHEALSAVWRLLALCLGEPPSTFEWKGNTYTPLQWRAGFMHDYDNYVMLMNDPRLEYGRMYRIEGSHGAADAPEWTFLNLSMDDLEAIGIASLSQGDRFYFTVDTSRDVLSAPGIYDTHLAWDTYMDREQMFLSRDISSVHAMAMCGYALDGEGKVARWVSENSFGVKRGPGGYALMEAEWWRRYCFRMAADRKYLSASQLKAAEGTPTVLPRWNLY